MEERRDQIPPSSTVEGVLQTSFDKTCNPIPCHGHSCRVALGQKSQAWESSSPMSPVPLSFNHHPSAKHVLVGTTSCICQKARGMAAVGHRQAKQSMSIEGACLAYAHTPPPPGYMHPTAGDPTHAHVITPHCVHYRANQHNQPSSQCNQPHQQVSSPYCVLLHASPSFAG